MYTLELYENFISVELGPFSMVDTCRVDDLVPPPYWIFWGPAKVFLGVRGVSDGFQSANVVVVSLRVV